MRSSWNGPRVQGQVSLEEAGGGRWWGGEKGPVRRRQHWRRRGHRARDAWSPEKLDAEEGPSPGAWGGRPPAPRF